MPLAMQSRWLPLGMSGPPGNAVPVAAAQDGLIPLGQGPQEGSTACCRLGCLMQNLFKDNHSRDDNATGGWLLASFPLSTTFYADPLGVRL